MHVILAMFGLEHPPAYEGQSFAHTKATVFVQAHPKSETDELGGATMSGQSFYRNEELIIENHVVRDVPSV